MPEFSLSELSSEPPKYEEEYDLELLRGVRRLTSRERDNPLREGEEDEYRVEEPPYESPNIDDNVVTLEDEVAVMISVLEPESVSSVTSPVVVLVSVVVSPRVKVDDE